jgi:UDP-glucose 4-epimerase
MSELFDACRAESGTPPAAMVHLAGIGIAAEADANHEQAISSNVTLTERLLAAMHARASAASFIFASTGAVYGIRADGPAREEDLPAPGNVYAASKLAAEAFCHAAARRHGLSCEIIRISNVYGPESGDHTVLGRLLNQAKRGESLAALTPNPIRDFIYIDDVAEGIVRLLDTGYESGCRITNLSTGVGTRICDAAEIIRSIVGGPAAAWQDSANGHDDTLILSNQNLTGRTGWRPHYTMAAGLRAVLTGELS